MEKYAIVDVETTGGSYRSDKIIEIAVIVYQKNEIVEEFTSLINPNRNIPFEITRITGITDDMVKNAPRFYEIARNIADLTQGCVFVAHNVHFDYSFIREEFRQLGYSYTRRKLCTVQLAKRYFSGLKSYSLDNLINHLNIQNKQRHRALDDTRATLEVFKHILHLASNDHAEISPLTLLLNKCKFPPNLDFDKILRVPDDCGVYYMKDAQGNCMYVGKSLKMYSRLIQHFSETSAKNHKLLRLVRDIDYKLCGSELMALLVELQDIQRFQPEINRALKRRKYSHHIVMVVHHSGFFQYRIIKDDQVKDRCQCILSFSTSISAKHYLNHITEKYQLCQNIQDWRDNPLKPCINYQLGSCLGACAGKETTAHYNNRFYAMHQTESTLFRDDFIIIDKGGNPYERSAFVIESGFCTRIGYLDTQQTYESWDSIVESLEPYTSSIESNRIIHHYITKKKNIKILRKAAFR